MTKYNEDDFSTEQNKDTKSFSFYLLKSDNELFIEDNNVLNTVISIKRIKLSNKMENWQILQNNKIVLLLKGTRFTKNERLFFHSADGMSFLIKTYKEGIHTVVKIKEKMKSVLR